MTTSPIRFDKDSDNIVTITFDAPGARVNTMTAEWQTAFTETVARLASEIQREKTSIKGVILASGKKTFFAGAELKDVLKFAPDQGPAVFHWTEDVKKPMRALEKLGIPVVAALEGTALGGGWEIALCAHCRIVLDDPSIQLGLPEVTLGLLPGAGGVTKTVRLLGLQAAFPYLVEGKTMRPQEAAKLGLVQGLASNRDDLFRMAREWINANPAPKQPWDDENYRMPGGVPSSSPKVSQMLSIAPAMVMEKTRGVYPAPKAILAVMVEGAYVDFDTALRIESRYLAKLAVGAVAKNLISLFFNRNAIKSGASRPKDVPKWKATKVGILGAGMMGGGIAWANMNRGVSCMLKDTSLEKAEAGKAYSAKILERRGREMNPLMLIKATADMHDLAGCDLIIEAVFEKRDLKAQVTKEAEPMLAAGGIFASNTSTLPISGLARASAQPEKFIGLHFFSPVDRMELVEIIKGEKTSAETLAKAYDYVLQIGKTPIVVNDSRGFYTSRTFSTFVHEGCAMLAEGIPAAAIENAARQAGMPVGPLEVIDQTSLSLSVQVMEQTIADLKAEGKALPPEPPGQQVIVKMVKELNRPGRATGGGFYEYPKDGKKFLWPELNRIFGRNGVAFDIDEMKDRILYRQAIETARCLEEGVLTTVHDANIGSIYGIGFPAWTGGALQFINSVGPAKFVVRADELAKKHGDRFAPPKLLRDKAARSELLN